MKSVLTSVVFRPYGWYRSDGSSYPWSLDVIPLLSRWSFLFNMSYSSGQWMIQLDNPYRSFEVRHCRDELFLKTAHEFLRHHRAAFSNFRTPSLYI